jgi:hypothetical protein
MAACNSVSSLKRVHDAVKIRDKISELVFFARWLMLSSGSRIAASGLLETVPSDEGEASEFMQVMDPVEDVSPNAGDMKALANIHDRWAALMAHAALISPDRMADYVRYLPLAANDSHSDFASRAVQVCKKLPKQFHSAFATLSSGWYI